LPGEVGAGGAGDGDLELAVVDRGDRVGEGTGQRAWGGHGARDAPFGWPRGGIDRADAKAELVYGNPLGAQALDDRGREERQLGRPYARRHLHDQHAALDGDGLGPLRDADAHRFLPDVRGDGLPSGGEAILAGAGEDVVDGLGEAEPGPALFVLRHGPSVPKRGIGRKARRTAGSGARVPRTC
jgi:hypothetical protein